ncbi:MAG: FAD-binding oxidoreductase [Patescibacteria group bacterium]
MDANRLKEFFQGEVLTDLKTLEAYSSDASVFEVKPEIVVKPKNTTDLKNLVAFVSREKKKNPDISLTARSGGTDMSGGSLNDSIIVDMNAHFNRIVEISGMAATIEPGVFYRNFEVETLKKGLLLPSYPASKNICTLGGMIANNSGGEKSLSYGKTEDYVERLDVVLSDGESYTFEPLSKQELAKKKKSKTFEGTIYREMYALIEKNYDLIKAAKPNVSKNSAGYFLWNVWNKETFDLTKLFVGSQGTLGFVTKARLKLIKPKSQSELLVIFLKDLKSLGDLAKTVLKYKPESFESYDDHTLKMAMRFLPELLKQMKGNAITLGLRFLPELRMTITGGMPKLVLIAEFTGDNEGEVIARLKQAEKEVQQKFHLSTHTTRSRGEAEKYWIIRRESFNLLRKHVSGKHTAPFIDDFIVRPDQLPDFLPQLNKILDQYPSLIYTVAGHVGDANFHIIPLMDLKDPNERAIIPKLSEEVYKLVLEFQGSITAEHNDGLIRTPYLEQMYGKKIYALFKQVKKIFDPQNIFNPRKKIGGTIEYALDHIKRK